MRLIKAVPPASRTKKSGPVEEEPGRSILSERKTGRLGAGREADGSRGD